jgi:hypothetical protein
VRRCTPRRTRADGLGALWRDKAPRRKLARTQPARLVVGADPLGMLDPPLPSSHGGRHKRKAVRAERPRTSRARVLELRSATDALSPHVARLSASFRLFSSRISGEGFRERSLKIGLPECVIFRGADALGKRLLDTTDAGARVALRLSERRWSRRRSRGLPREPPFPLHE